MKVALQVFGILIVIGSGLILIVMLLALSTGNMSENVLTMLMYSVIGLIIGIVMIAGSSGIKGNINKFDMQEFEEFKRYQEQQRRIYYRNANAQGKPIGEYLMDDKTKLVTYYDRMPTAYKDKLVNYADKLYREFENEEYLNRK
jgi:hypothetical protein